MNKLYGEDEIESLIKNNSMTIIYFTWNSCSACEVIKIKIEEIIRKLKRAQSSMSIKENLWQWIIEISFII